MPEATTAEAAWYAPWMLAAGAALLTFLLMRKRSQWRVDRSARRRPETGPDVELPPPPAPWTGPSRDASADRAQVELHELARELRGQLDSKIIVLNELVAQSQRQIERLETLLEEAREI